MTGPKPIGRRRFATALFGSALTGCALPRARAGMAAPSRRKQMMSLVVREAVDLRVPISLALAVAHAESNFDAHAESPKGARGVMQIMPATAMGEYGIAADRLWDPRLNVRVGLHFLRRLIDRYGGRIDWALSYYNGGSAVGPPSQARVIPATRNYVRKVTRLRRHYRRALQRGEV